MQEEPRNMGARKFVLPKIRDVIPEPIALSDVSRPERSSPAEGYPAATSKLEDLTQGRFRAVLWDAERPADAKRYPNLKEIVWVQEEPRNMGARKFVLPKIRDVIPEPIALSDVSRPERSSPAEGYPAAHQAEQAKIVAAAYGS